MNITFQTMLSRLRTLGTGNRTFTRGYTIFCSSPRNFRPPYTGNKYLAAVCTRLCSNVPLDEHCKQPITHPTKGKLIYAGQLNNKVKMCKSLSLTTCVAGIGGQIYLLLNAASLPNSILFMGSSSLAFFMFISTGIIQFITMRYLTDIYFNSQTGKFTAGKITFFLRRKEIEYTANDVHVPEISGPLSNIKIKGKPYIAFDVYFKDHDAFIHMLGYDKPLDIKMDTEKEE